MPTTQFNHRVDTGRAVGTNRVNTGMAQYAGAGMAAFADATSSIAGMVHGAVQKKRNEQKDLEISADNEMYQAFMQQRLAAAHDKASKTNNPEEIDGIYAQYATEEEEYRVGTNKDGISNIRWDDHQNALTEHSGAFKMQSETAALRRRMEVDNNVTIDRTGNALDQAVGTKNKRDVPHLTQEYGAAQGWNKEEISAETDKRLLEVESNQAQSFLYKISTADPAILDEAFDDFEAKLAGKDFFVLMDDDERRSFLNAARGEVNAAKGREKKEKLDVQIKGNQEMINFYMKENRVPTPTEMLDMGIPKETIAMASAGHYEKVLPAFEGIAAIDFRQEILTYDPDEDPSKVGLVGFTMRIEQFESTGVKKMLKDALTRVSDDEYNELQGTLENYIEETLLNPDFQNTFGTFGADGMSKEEAAQIPGFVSKQIDEFKRYAGTVDYDPKKMMDYVHDPDGVIQRRKSATNYEDYTGRIQARVKYEFNPQGANLIDSQVAFVDDETSSLVGLLQSYDDLPGSTNRVPKF